MELMESDMQTFLRRSVEATKRVADQAMTKSSGKKNVRRDDSPSVWKPLLQPETPLK